MAGNVGSHRGWAPASDYFTKYNAVNVITCVMTRAVIMAKGIVQCVGFRYAVRDAAVSLGINGSVRNLDDGDVEIIAEGTESNIDSLVQRIRNAKEPIMVTDVSVSYEEVPDEFESFVIVAGDLTREIIEGFGTWYHPPSNI